MKLKRFLYAGLLIVALIVAACSPQATPEPTAKPEPTATPVPPTDTPAPAATMEVTIPSISTSGEVPMGFTEDGSPYRGYPDAPVTLVEHSEFQ
jgi:PBP1b-binding outer membrane lipoprotein LpoB